MLAIVSEVSMVRRTSEEWRLLVEDWIASGQGCEEWAAPRGILASTLGWWRWKLGMGTVRAAEPTRFLDVVVREPGPPPAPDLVVEVGALRVRVPVGFDARELRRVVDALC